MISWESVMLTPYVVNWGWGDPSGEYNKPTEPTNKGATPIKLPAVKKEFLL